MQHRTQEQQQHMLRAMITTITYRTAQGAVHPLDSSTHLRSGGLEDLVIPERTNDESDEMTPKIIKFLS